MDRRIRALAGVLAFAFFALGTLNAHAHGLPHGGAAGPALSHADPAGHGEAPASAPADACATCQSAKPSVCSPQLLRATALAIQSLAVVAYAAPPVVEHSFYRLLPERAPPSAS